MCIYYKDIKDLTYKSQEHIIPAGLGGKEKLPSGYVSDQANNYFSKFEMDFYLSSPAGRKKNLLGIGSRGSKEIKNIPIDVIKIENGEERNFVLGFKFNEEINQIDFIRIDNKNISIGPDNHKIFLSELIELIDKNKKFVFIFNGLLNGIVLIGINDNKIYIASDKNRDKIKLDDLKKYLKRLSDSLNDCEYEIKMGTNQTTGYCNIQNKKEHAKIYVKIAFNVIAKIMDKEYVLKTQFDLTREWIMGSNNNLNMVYEKINLTDRLNLGKKVHCCLIYKRDNKIFAEVSLFDQGFRFNLCEECEDIFKNPILYVCDIEKKEEYWKLITI